MASYNKGKLEVVNWITSRFSRGSSCLDVGACDGKWYNLLGQYLNMDCIEIFQPNIDEYHLKEKYNNVFCKNIIDFEYEWYDLIIFGDVLEHMSIEDAQKVINYAKPRCRDMIIAIPFLYKQDELYNNPYEKHIQDDLTNELFHVRYPGFTAIWTDRSYGYYHKIVNTYDLSVIIPCHNVCNYIDPLLDSLRIQKLYQYSVELIFICDKCEDNTANIILQYLQYLPQYKNITVMKTDYGLAGQARNTGLDFAKGYYIMFADSDDWFLIDEVFSACIQILDSTHNKLLRFKFGYTDDFPMQQFIDNNQDKAMIWQYCYKHEFIGNIRFLSLPFNEDVDFINQLFSRYQNIVYTDCQSKFYFYNYGREGSLTTLLRGEELNEV